MKKAPVITIDGPSGSGKGTISRWLAKKLGWHMLDSGALYRLVGLDAVNQSIALEDIPSLVATATNLDVEFTVTDSQEPQVWLRGQDVSMHLGTEETGKYASQVAAIPEVRAALLARQHGFRQLPGLVADGRDMGTVVFADAEIKIFLTADAQSRAERRYKQLIGKGISANLHGLLRDIKARDERDQNRASSPLVPAPDAKILDTTDMGVEAVCERVFTYAQHLIPK